MKEDDLITTSPFWRKNLVIAWFGCFLTGASFSLVMPFMPIFVRDLGATGTDAAFYSGMSVSISALAAAIVSPLWGRLADRYGRKPMMIRASLVMTFTMGGLAFINNVFWLLFLRLMNGLFAGFIPNSNALIASQAPKEELGKALGILATGNIGGALIGPLIGGFLAQLLGVRNVFLLVGGLLFLASLLTIFFIEEDFTPVPKEEALSTHDLVQQVKDPQVLIGLFISSMVIQISAQSVSPILTLYIEHLGQTENLMMISGTIVSAMGFSSMLSSAYLGRIGDKIGNHRLILLALSYCTVIYLLMAQATDPLQLGILRFLFGFGTGSLMPSINALLTKITPKEGISTIFGYNLMFINLGQVIGPFIGSAVATMMGYESVFYVTSAIVFFNLIWCLVNFRHYLKVKEI